MCGGGRRGASVLCGWPVACASVLDGFCLCAGVPGVYTCVQSKAATPACGGGVFFHQIRHMCHLSHQSPVNERASWPVEKRSAPPVVSYSLGSLHSLRCRCAPHQQAHVLVPRSLLGFVSSHPQHVRIQRPGPPSICLLASQQACWLQCAGASRARRMSGLSAANGELHQLI